jgi:hypothetical protein
MGGSSPSFVKLKGSLLGGAETGEAAGGVGG